jgi:hypothetical protein
MLFGAVQGDTLQCALELVYTSHDLQAFAEDYGQSSEEQRGCS